MTEPDVPRPSRAEAAIVAYVAEQCRAIQSSVAAMDTSHETAIHDARVGIRRLRSALRVYAPMLVPLPVPEMDAELQWFAGILGAVRDCQVLRVRLDLLVTSMAGDLPDGTSVAVADLIDNELRRDYTERWQHVEQEQQSERYVRLMAELEDWAEELPELSGPEKASRTMRKLVRQAERDVPRRLRRASKHHDPEKLHSARKAAKRARYAEEAAAPIVGRKASARSAKRYRRLQEVLGEHQDSLLSATFLKRLATNPELGANVGYALGVLHERELRSAASAERRARALARK